MTTELRDADLLGAAPGIDTTAAVEDYEAIRDQAWRDYQETGHQAWRDYEAIRHQAWRDYEAIRHKAQETYGAETYGAIDRSAREAYEAIRDQAWGDYEAIERPAREAYEANRRLVREAYEAIERPAREALAEAVSGAPLAKWIVENAMGSYSRQALMVLRALPCTAATLHRLAADEDWCDTWAEMWSRAAWDGVVPTWGRVVNTGAV